MSSNEGASKLWGGRFSGKTDPIMEQFNNSLKFDRIMWQQDLNGSYAYAQAMQKTGILTAEEADKICEGIKLIENEWKTNTFVIQSSDEDIHTANERRLTELIGPIGGKLHTGRSRNDQVATDLRLWLFSECNTILKQLEEIITAATDGAETYIDIIQAGYTHLQPAQPIRYSHWLLSYIIPLLRDMERLKQLSSRVNICPLGSGALAGHAFGINRNELASSLGFYDVTINSIDATCDRDFVVEFLNWASLLMVHISQLSEDLIILNMQKSIILSDAYCTGSSLMPQKKNPDGLELLRGKTGRIIGNNVGFLVTLKGLPHAYNKDLQEDKEALFDTTNTIHDCLHILYGIISTITPIKEKLYTNLVSEMLATDIAEYLVRKNVPFRETHHIAGRENYSFCVYNFIVIIIIIC